jgi:hypothetical protein
MKIRWSQLSFQNMKIARDVVMFTNSSSKPISAVTTT